MGHLRTVGQFVGQVPLPPPSLMRKGQKGYASDLSLQLLGGDEQGVPNGGEGRGITEV